MEDSAEDHSPEGLHVPSTLIDLLARYREAEKHRAWGGVRALSGWDFQIRSYIADFALSLVRSDDLAEAGEDLVKALLEAFSDYSLDQPGNTVVVQAKRSLTGTTLRKTANEFLVIDAFLQREAPELAPHVTFEVTAKTGDTTLRWEDVRFDAKDKQERFERLRLAGRLKPPRFCSDPTWQLLACVHAVLDDPIAFAREALDAALRRGECDAENVRHRIYESYVKHRLPHPTLPPDVQWLRIEDFAYRTSTSCEIAVGRSPSIDLYRDAQYMERPRCVESARAALSGLLASRHDSPFRNLDVFWIHGPSGCGKSAFLIQMMHHLVLEGATVVWLQDRVEAIHPLLERYSGNEELGSLPEFLFIDDLYDRQSQTTLDVDAIASLVESQPFVEWPIVVTCGPPEFLDALKREMRGGLQVHDWLLPLVAPSEALELRKWYTQRTGRQPSVGQSFRQPGGLMISMAAELRHGELSSFASRFYDRLEVAHLVAPLQELLALNRLYIWTLRCWLTREELERLDHLNQDDDFSILGTGAERRRYLRLTHPHISDAVYKALRWPPTRTAFAADLASAFERALNTDLLTAVRLLRVFSSGHERLLDVDVEELATRCVATWRGSSDLETRLDPHLRAELWCSWAIWADRSPRAREIDPSPLSRARSEVWKDRANWTHHWHRLWEALPSAPMLVRDAAVWLREEVGHKHWPYTWQELTKLGEANRLPEGIELNDLLQRGHSWLTGREDRSDWSHVWERLAKLGEAKRLPEGIELNDLLRWGHSWLTGREDRSDWYYVWRRLAESGEAKRLPEGIELDELLRWGHSWLTGREDRPEWAYVWGRLAESGGENRLPKGIELDELLRWGHSWLTGREDRSEWSHVWRRLAESGEEKRLPKGIALDELLRWGHSWLTGREDRSEWYYVWRRLAESGEAKRLPKGIALDELLRWGHSWLTGREDRSEWAYVWRRLAESGEAKRLPKGIALDELLRWGHSWLTGREDRSEWYYVWRRLAESGEEKRLPKGIALDELLRWGHSWLTGREDRSEWSHVWEWLMKLGEANRLPEGIELDELLRWGHSWLTDREDRSEWYYVWRRLAESGEENRLPEGIELDELLRWGHSWLTDREDRPEWSHVWEWLMKLGEANRLPEGIELDKVVSLGRHWLEGREAQDDWSFVWQKLSVLASPYDASHWLIEILKPWIEDKAARQRGEWDKLYETALDAGYKDEQFLRLGGAWCLEHTRERQTPPLAAKILAAAPNDPPLAQLAAWLGSWLRTHSTGGTARFVGKFLKRQTKNLSSSLTGWSDLKNDVLNWFKMRQDAYKALVTGQRYEADVVRVKGDRVFVAVGGTEGVLIPSSVKAQAGGKDAKRPFRRGDRVNVVAVSVDLSQCYAEFALTD